MATKGIGKRRIIGLAIAAMVCCAVAVVALWQGNGLRKKPLPAPRVFHRDLMLPVTPVKNQGNSSLCWAYAMLATIETEHLAQGDSVNLSVDYVARAYLQEQTENRFLHGFPFNDDSNDDISTRGMAPMLIDLIENYGLTHYDAYHREEQTDFNVIARKLQKCADGAMSLSDMHHDMEQILDKGIGPVPQSVYLLGTRYTPLEFTHSVCRDDEWVAMTSFTHHPFYQRCVLEVPDNRYHSAFLNVPIDTLMAKIEQSVRKGHPVCWEGDISEPRFDWEAGFAQLPDETRKTTQEERQAAFEHHQTTDDHCMAIVGLAHDSEGRRYFIMKNSWGASNLFKGYIYVSFPYVRMKTIAVMVNAAMGGLPKAG